MYKFLKALHIIGVVLFFGSILGHAIAGVVSSGTTDSQVLNVVRQVVQAETIYLTIPGLVLFSITGGTMIFVGKLPIKKLKWLALHLALGILVILNALIILGPLGQEMLVATQALAAGTGSIELIHELEIKEAIFGAINIILCVLLVLIAVIKPKLGGNK